jgi:uncharacterized MAPEG superfamily protein
MTTDLICLLILSLWTVVLNHTPAIARVMRSGLQWGMGNRETSPDVPPWVGRADRAQRNHHDNLTVMAIAILTAQVTGQADDVTAIAAIVITGCRILHSLTYMFGLSAWRSAFYFGGLIATIVIIWRSLT